MDDGGRAGDFPFIAVPQHQTGDHVDALAVGHHRRLIGVEIDVGVGDVGQMDRAPRGPLEDALGHVDVCSTSPGAEDGGELVELMMILGHATSALKLVQRPPAGGGQHPALEAVFGDGRQGGGKARNAGRQGGHGKVS